MALISHFIPEPDCHLMVWRIDEPEDYFKERLGKKHYQLPDYESISHPSKQLEWLASRFLAKELAESLEINYDGLIKDHYNKPYLKDSSHHLSLSHSLHSVAAAIHLHQPIGIDLEAVSSRLHIIEHKFLTDTERSFAQKDLQKLTVLWSAKESLYKLWGKRGLHFQKQILVEPFEDTAYYTTGKIVLDNEAIEAKIYFYKIANEYLTLAV